MKTTYNNPRAPRSNAANIIVGSIAKLWKPEKVLSLKLFATGRAEVEDAKLLFTLLSTFEKTVIKMIMVITVITALIEDAEIFCKFPLLHFIKNYFYYAYKR